MQITLTKKGVRGRICHAVLWYVKANNKYMKYYDNNKESPYLKNCDFNNIYRWAMSQKLPVNGFIGLKISQFNENFTKITNEESDGCFLEVDFQYREKLHNLQNDLPFLPERMKTGKLIANLHNKKGICYSHKKFKTTLNHGLILKKKQRIESLNLIKTIR